MHKPSSIRQNIPECRPFFVVGAQRSGTTMLRLMLNNHPNLAIPFETGFVPIFYKKLAEYGDMRDKENTARLLGDISRYHKVEQGGLIIGETYHGQMSDYPTSAEHEMPDKSMQWQKSSVRALDPSKVYGWKREMSLADRIIFEQTAGDALELFRYEKNNLAGTVGSPLKRL